MSQDPQRLLSATSDADELERELLASVRQVDPTRGAHREVWGGIATQIAAATLATAATASALGTATSGSAGAATSAIGASMPAAAAQVGKAGAFTLSKALATKLVLGLALGGAAAGAGSAWVTARQAPPSVMRNGTNAPHGAAKRSTSAVVESARKVAAETDVALSAPSLETTAQESQEAQRALASRRPGEPKAQDRLGAESQLLAKARAELRNGNAGAAQATLQRLQARFPKGVLRQELEVLEIEILAARGKAAASEQRARDFIKAHPESPHSTNLRRSLEQP